MILFILQVIYIIRVDWSRKALKAHTLCLKKNRKSIEKQTTTISLVVLSGSEFSKLESVGGGGGENSNGDVIEVNSGVVAMGNQTTRVKPTLKRKLTKKALLFTALILLFVSSILVKDLYEIRSPTFMNKPMFSNWTFLIEENKNATQLD